MKIGLEVHVALQTKSKLFCSCSSTAEEPNTAVCPICLGMPGAKPMLNSEALKISVAIARALHCDIIDKAYFIRKVYFYPDLPKSYQITQLDGAVGSGGYVMVNGKKVRIRRVQLEEDPAKVVREDEYSLLDFNRSGVPLNEIVTEQDIGSEEELRGFVSELRSILYYVGVDIDREMKIDLNISLGGERVEIKNVTGIKNLIDAERYECKRQSGIIAAGGKVQTETRSYSAETMSTISSREKESDEEYGFIYDPDLGMYPTNTIHTDETPIAREIAERYSAEYGTNAETIRELIMFDRNALRLLRHVAGSGRIGAAINAISMLKRTGAMDMDEKNFDRMLEYIGKGMLLSDDAIKALKAGKEVEMSAGAVSAQEIDKAIMEVVKSREDLVTEYSTNPKAFNFIVGLILKKYKVSPRYVSERLGEVLEGLV